MLRQRLLDIYMEFSFSCRKAHSISCYTHLKGTIKRGYFNSSLSTTTTKQITANSIVTSSSASQITTTSSPTSGSYTKSTLTSLGNNTSIASTSLNSAASASELHSTKTDFTSELETVTCTETKCMALSTQSKSSIHDVYTTVVACSSYSLHTDVSGNVITSTILTTSLETVTCTETKCKKPSATPAESASKATTIKSTQSGNAGVSSQSKPATTSKSTQSGRAGVSSSSKPATATANLTEIATSSSMPSIVTTVNQEGSAANLKIPKGFTMLFGLFFLLF
ncbi:unnamed protein product [Hanseniaspora opuntiae]